MKRSKFVRLFRIKPGSKFRCDDHKTDYSKAKGLRDLSGDELKDEVKEFIQENLKRLSDAQELLYSSDRFSVLIILQAMDSGGKDSMIKHVMSGLNPQGCQVSSFKKPSEEELQHTFLWRCSRRLPERGNIGIFNRSYYEDVLVVRVHPEFLAAQKLLSGPPDEAFWEKRYEDINHFEHHLARNNTLILKFFLHISKQEQKKRFLERLNNPEKHWKFNSADLAERALWPAYMGAFEKAITATSTKWAPWHVIPADQKWIARAAVSAIVTQAIESLGLEQPKVGPERLKDLAKAKAILNSEKEATTQ